MQRSSRIDSLKSMLAKEPYDLFLNFALGLEYINDPETLTLAEHQFKLVLTLNENYIAAYYQLGKFFEAANKNTEALEIYHSGLTKAREQKNNKAVNEFSEAIYLLED